MFSNRLCWIVAVSCISSPAFAQGVPPPAPSKTYTLTLSADKLNIILEALASASLPWKTTNPVITDLYNQVQKQDAPPAPPSDKP